MLTCVYRVAIIAALLAAPGCLPTANQAPGGDQQLSPEALMAAWRELPKVGRDRLGDVAAEAASITQRLVFIGGIESLKPMLDLLGDPHGDPVAKVLAVISLTPLMPNPILETRLNALTGDTHEATTRVCAIHLLGLNNTDTAAARLHELRNDSEPRVRAEAGISLLMRHDPDMIAHVLDLWNDPSVTDQHRGQMIHVLPENRAGEYLPIYRDALNDLDIDSTARHRAALVLGSIGDASVLDALRTCAANDPDPGLRAIAESAIAAIEARTGAAPAAPQPS